MHGPNRKKLRGWKEISSYLGTSERSAKRWEQTRALPVHRVAGLARDALFAWTDELDAWVDSRPVGDEQAEAAEGPGPGTETGGRAAADAIEPSTKLEIPGRRRIAVLVSLALGLVVVAIVGATLFSKPAGRTDDSARDTTEHEKSLTLRLSTPGQSNLLKVTAGECAQFAPAGMAPVELCPHVLRDGLLLEIIGRPQSLPPGERESPVKVNVRLEPNAEVRVTRPFTFDVEWLVERPATR